MHTSTMPAWRAITSALLLDMRWLRLTYYVMMFVLGICLGIKTQETSGNLAPLDNTAFIKPVILTIISIILAGLSSIVVNNLADLPIDQLVNRDRPLISTNIAHQHYAWGGRVAALAAIICSATVNLATCLTIIAVMLNYYLYSAPPVRYKRITVLSKLVISTNSLALTLLGYRTCGASLALFSPLLIIAILLPGTIAANYIDLKDYSGDLAHNIMTLPVLLGHKLASIIIGGGFIVTYILLALLLQQHYYLLLFGASGLIMYYLVTKIPYSDRLVTLWQVLNIASLCILLLYAP